LIVLEGLQGKLIAAIGHEHQISQSQYYQGRDQCLANAANAFEVHQHTRQEAHRAQENASLKPLVGELPREFNTSAELLGGNGAGRSK
jgi:hypothetical protein